MKNKRITNMRKERGISTLEVDKKDDILFQIDMQLYDEFNDKFCEINEYLGDIYTYKDLDDLEKAEKDKEIKLLREAIKNLIADNKRLDKENQALFEAYNFNDTNLLAKTLKEYRKEILNSIPKLKVREKIEELIKEADYRTTDNLKGRVHFQPEPVDFQIAVLQELLQEGDK